MIFPGHIVIINRTGRDRKRKNRVNERPNKRTVRARETLNPVKIERARVSILFRSPAVIIL